MKLSIERESLYSALQQIQSVVEKKNTVQILSNILCHVQGQNVVLSATDLEVGVRVSLPANVQEEGKITLSAKHFFDIVKELPQQPVYLSRKQNDWIEIVSGKSRFNIVSLSASDYPALPEFEDRDYYEAKADVLLEMINKTAFAVSTDATRYHLNGVFFEHLGNNLMRMTATGGHRLSFVDSEIFLKMPDFKRGLIIPRKGLAELRKLLEGGIPRVGLSFDRGYFFASAGRTYLFIRLIEGEYPDYKPVIPKAATKIAKIKKSDFQSALKRVSLLAHEKSRGVKFALTNKLLIVTSQNPDMGDAREEIDVEYNGEAIETGFNAKYLLECLDVIEDEDVEPRLVDKLSPGILQGPNLRNHTYVIMPMRI